MAYGRIAAVGKCTTVYGTSENETVVLTDNNILCFTDTISGVTRSANTYFYTLPNVIPYPSRIINFVADYSEGGTHYQGSFYITTSGNVGTRQALNNATVFFNGVCVNLNNDFYNSTIGNNDMNAMTSPINAR